MYFKDRKDAANRLSEALITYKNSKSVVVGIPKGGVEVGFYISKDLHLPLSYILTKKIGHPEMPEYAIGVVSIDDEFLDEKLLKLENIPDSYIESEIQRIRDNLKKSAENYPLVTSDYFDKNIILTDDGIATGKTMFLTLKLLKQKKPKKIIVAIPVGPLASIESIKELADEVICLYTPAEFLGISQFYSDFKQLDDTQVQNYLRKANEA